MGDLNIKSSTIEKGLDLAQTFLAKLFGPAVGEVGELMADRVKLWKFTNQVKVLEKAKRICEAKNIPLRQINLKTLVPYLDGCSLEEDETIQTLWANLLVNYIDEAKNLTTTVYPTILTQLSSSDITVLLELQKQGYRKRYAYKTKRTEKEGYDLSNLLRLGLIEREEFLGGMFGARYGRASEIEYSDFSLTEFGNLFIDACQREK